MMSKTVTKVRPVEHENPEHLAKRWSSLGDDVGSPLSGEPLDDVEVSLSLGDLMRDTNGEVVLYNDSNLRCLAIDTDSRIVGQGISPRHVTASGEDVTGFRFITFDNGVKLYYGSELELIVRHEPT